MYKLVYTKQALKDAKKLSRSELKDETLKLLDILKNNPYQNSPPYEQLKGELRHAFSRRINYQHRLVYEIIVESKIVKILRMWTHYE